MSDHDDPEFERFLRRALHEHAADILPAGDGLSKIQDRIGRRRRTAWFRPAVATLAAAGAAVGIIALPSVFDSGSGSHRGSAASSGSSRLTQSPTTKATTFAPRLSVSKPVAWPVGTTGQAQRIATSKKLADPRALATDLVTAFAGTGDPAISPLKLTTSPVRRSAGAAEVDVRRPGSGRPICSVHLVRLDGGQGYVVADATSPEVQIGTDTTIPAATKPIRLAGTVTPPADTAGMKSGIVRLDIRKPGERLPVSAGAGYYSLHGVPNQAWTATLNPGPAWPQHGVVAAWTVDGDGLVVSFAAEPATLATAASTATPSGR